MLFRWPHIVSDLYYFEWQLQRLDWRTISNTVLVIARFADIGMLHEYSYWMMLRLSVRMRQTVAVGLVWCSNLPVNELTVPTPKWWTPWHIIRRSFVIPLEEQSIEVQ
jgi:hypothetical protein